MFSPRSKAWFTLKQVGGFAAVVGLCVGLTAARSGTTKSLCTYANLSIYLDAYISTIPANTDFDVTAEITNNADTPVYSCNLSPEITGAGTITLNGDDQGIFHDFDPWETYPYTVHFHSGSAGPSKNDLIIHAHDVASDGENVRVTAF